MVYICSLCRCILTCCDGSLLFAVQFSVCLCWLVYVRACMYVVIYQCDNVPFCFVVSILSKCCIVFELRCFVCFLQLCFMYGIYNFYFGLGHVQVLIFVCGWYLC